MKKYVLMQYRIFGEDGCAVERVDPEVVTIEKASEEVESFYARAGHNQSFGWPSAEEFITEVLEAEDSTTAYRNAHGGVNEPFEYQLHVSELEAYKRAQIRCHEYIIEKLKTLGA